MYKLVKLILHLDSNKNVMNKNIIYISLILIGLTISCSGDKELKEVAILKYVTHPALDELESAYIERLDNLLKDSKEPWYIKEYNSNANPTSASTIARSFQNKNVGHILTIATPAAIAVSKNTTDIPHIYGAVADPKGAKIIPSVRSTGIANAGENIIREALIFIKAVYGDDVRIGTIYNPQEQNSIYIQNLMTKLCSELELSLRQVTVQSTGNLNGVTNALCREVDVIYSANDNTVNSGVGAVTAVTNEYNIPFIIGDLSTLNKGALFAIGLEYKSMGHDLAEISYKIIKYDSISIKSFPPQDAPKPEIWINQSSAKALNFKLSDSLKIKFSIKLK